MPWTQLPWHFPGFYKREQEGWWQKRWLCCSQESNCGENDTSLSPRVWTALINSAFPLTFLFCLIFLMNPVCLISRIFIVLKQFFCCWKWAPARAENSETFILRAQKKALLSVLCTCSLSAVTDLFSVLQLPTVISLLSTSQLPPFLLIQKTTWEQAEPTHSSLASPRPQTQGALHLPETYRERT